MSKKDWKELAPLANSVGIFRRLVGWRAAGTAPCRLTLVNLPRRGTHLVDEREDLAQARPGPRPALPALRDPPSPMSTTHRISSLALGCLG